VPGTQQVVKKKCWLNKDNYDDFPGSL
jgi:hypothetical protein